MTPRVIAHRGASLEAAENSKEAIRLAGTQGADLIEIDVRTTADDVVVVHHDADLMRSAGDPRRIAALPWSQLRSMRLHWGRNQEQQTLLRLEDALQAAHSVPLAIEIKTPEVEPTAKAALVLDILHHHDPEARSRIISFDRSIVEVATRRLGPARTGLILNRRLSPRKRQETAATAAGIIVLARPVASVQVVEQLRQAGKDVWIYCLDDEKTIRPWLSTGLGGIITNRPTIARNVIDRWLEP